MKVSGHRGASGCAPENTLAAFRKAVKLGVRLIELDVRLTRDGALICFHDGRLERLTPGWGPVAEEDWDALSQLPVLPGSFGGRYPDARIPLLSDVLKALPEDCEYLVELKPDPERPRQVVERTLATLGSAVTRCRLLSFDQALLLWAREIGPPGLRLSVLVGDSEREQLFPRARKVRAEAVHPHFTWVDEDFVRRAREEGFLVSAWTVNHEAEVRRLAELGVDEITTDYPRMALDVLGRDPGAKPAPQP